MCIHIELEKSGAIEDIHPIDPLLEHFTFADWLSRVTHEFDELSEWIGAESYSRFFDEALDEAATRRDPAGPWFEPGDGLQTFSALVPFLCSRIDEPDFKGRIGDWLMTARCFEQILYFAKSKNERFRLTW